MGVQVRSTVPSSDSDTTSYKDRQFITNDIVLLVRKESDIWDATRGTLYQSSPQQRKKKQSSSNNDGRLGIVGHVEYTRRSIEGLTIQVSRELWKEVGQSEMTLLKIGCNITSLREFTALCRLDSIPLLDYILGSKMSCKSKQQQLSTTTTGNKSSGVNEYDIDIIDPSVEEKRAKKEVLSSMGGSSALGKGFAEYASHKFNLSQLGAISASAQEYGDGGFTLIKGPPGTGKVRFHFWLCFF
jgi:senataxin